MTQIPTGNDKYELRVTKLSVIPPGDAVFNDTVTHVEIDDEAAGEFVAIRRNGGRFVLTCRIGE